MCTNFSKTHQALPMAMRFSSQPECFNAFPISKLRFISPGSSCPKSSQNPTCAISRTLTSGFSRTTLKTVHLSKPMNVFLGRSPNIVNIEESRSTFGCVCVGARLQRSHMTRGDVLLVSSYCSMSANAGSPSCSAGAGESLPWLSDSVPQASKGQKKLRGSKSSMSSWKEAAEKVLSSSHSTPTQEDSSKNRRIGIAENSQMKYVKRWDEHMGEDDDEEQEGEIEATVDDPRWDTIRNKVENFVNPKRVYQRPQSGRLTRQENWGRKTFKEATESSVPKIIGEGVYGVGPVLAALSAGRREFYMLYVQEGLDLNKNNKRKKDKKGFEKVLRLADKLGLSIKEVSKHDLNMVVDNRPHQGLVLDASPLEMVNIKELDPVSLEEDREGHLWVALDEVTDPQNLGAIVRSSYFFGAAGVIICAKNSAPLSGVVSKASAGSLELMEIRSCKNMMNFLTSSSQNGWRVLGGSVSPRATPLREVAPGSPTILVLGSEGTGLRPLVERSCTELVRIPGNIVIDESDRGVSDQEGEEVVEEIGVRSSQEYRSFLAVESLNVSVAAGVLLNHLTGKRES